LFLLCCLFCCFICCRRQKMKNDFSARIWTHDRSTVCFCNVPSSK
jgi:hypothetical protein